MSSGNQGAVYGAHVHIFAEAGFVECPFRIHLYVKVHVGFIDWAEGAGQWKQLSGSIKQEWGKLTDDDLDYIAGTKDRLVGRLQQKYGLAKEEADRRADAWLNVQNEPRKTA